MDSTQVIRYKGNETPPSTPTSSKYTPQLTSLPNLSNLTPDTPYTYKQLCEILEQPYLSSTSKTRQLLEWSRFFDYRKFGTKYFITRVYKEPMPFFPITRTFSTNQKYINDVMNIIISYLFSSTVSSEEVFYFSNLDLSILCGLVNNLYQKYYHEMDTLSKSLSIPQEHIKSFYSRSYIKLKDIITSALNSLQNRSIIMCIPTYIISFRTTASDDLRYMQYELREATDKDKLAILTMQKETLDEVGLKSKNELWYRPEDCRKRYNTIFQNKLSEHNPYWLSVSSVTKILAPYRLIREEIRNMDDAKEELNIQLFEFLNTQAKNKSLSTPSPSAWLDIQHLLSEKLILLSGTL